MTKIFTFYYDYTIVYMIEFLIYIIGIGFFPEHMLHISRK